MTMTNSNKQILDEILRQVEHRISIDTTEAWSSPKLTNENRLLLAQYKL
jgi:hypothetical protein